MPTEKLVVSTYPQHSTDLAVLIVAVISAGRRYLGETLTFEHWGEALLREMLGDGEEHTVAPKEILKAVLAGDDRGHHPREGDGW